MNKSLLAAGLIVLSMIMGLPEAQATPKKRFDPGTQTCRILTFANSGWVSPGNKIFKSSCKSCHSLGNDKGAPFLHTESKSTKAWNRVFEKKYPQCARDGSWKGLTLEEQLQLNDFLYRNAANSYDAYDADDCG